MTLTPEQREKLFNEWVKTLGLERWSIRAFLNVVPSECVLRDVAGECEYQTVIRSATVRVLRQEAYSDGNEYDFEKVLVHELLHLKFAHVYPEEDSVIKVSLHMLIEDLACAMVEAKRKGKTDD